MTFAFLSVCVGNCQSERFLSFLSFSLSHSFFLSLSLSLSISDCLSLSLLLSHSLSLSVLFSLSLCLFIFLILSLFLFLSFSISFFPSSFLSSLSSLLYPFSYPTFHCHYSISVLSIFSPILFL